MIESKIDKDIDCDFSYLLEHFKGNENQTKFVKETLDKFRYFFQKLYIKIAIHRKHLESGIPSKCNDFLMRKLNYYDGLFDKCFERTISEMKNHYLDDKCYNEDDIREIFEYIKNICIIEK